jgi:outer membrane lipoprotein SlyB
MVKAAPLVLALLLAACADGGGGYRTEPLPAAEPERSGVVEEVRPVPLGNNRVGSVAGTVVGGSAGAAAGRTVGSGRGSQASSVVGAVAGSIAGNMIAQSVVNPDGIEITLRLDNGRQLLVVQPAGETFKPGERVRVLSDQQGTRVTH